MCRRTRASYRRLGSVAGTCPCLTPRGTLHAQTPTDIRATAKLEVADALAAITANSAARFATAKYVTAGRAVNAYCGQDANGSVLSGTSTSS